MLTDGTWAEKEAQVVFTFGKPKEQCLEMLNELDTVTNSDVLLIKFNLRYVLIMHHIIVDKIFHYEWFYKAFFAYCYYPWFMVK